MGKVLVIGLDAATFDLIGPWAAAGKLPLFAQLMREGASGTLASTVPAMSPPAWTSIITGQNPGKHGIFDFMRRQPGTYTLQSMRSDFTRYRTVFELLSSYGKRVAAINIPLTYPPAVVNGIVISGLGAPAGSGRFTYPTSLRDELSSQGYHLMESEGTYEPGQDEAYVADLIRVAREQTRMAVDLLRREDWDLFFIVFRGIDEAQSFLWHHMDPKHPRHDPVLAERFGDAILQVHQATEEIMQSLIETAGAGTTVLLVSDHGGGSLIREVYLNAWLCQQGWLVLRQPGAISGMRRKVMSRLGLTRDKLTGRFADPLSLRLRRMIPLRVQHAVLPSETPTLAESVDWAQTKAYSFGYIGQIYVNLCGREPQGIVQSGQEYRDLIAAVTEALYNLVDPEVGVKIVDRVYHRDEIYHGPYAELGPDLNVVMGGMSYITHLRRELGSNEVFGPVSTDESGTHRPNGIFIAYGDHVSAGAHGFQASVYDVTPTILALLGIPIPAEIDGRVLNQAIPSVSPSADLSEKPPLIGNDSASKPISTDWESEEEERAVTKRLRDLGYLE